MLDASQPCAGLWFYHSVPTDTGSDLRIDYLTTLFDEKLLQLIVQKDLLRVVLRSRPTNLNAKKCDG